MPNRKPSKAVTIPLRTKPLPPRELVEEAERIHSELGYDDDGPTSTALGTSADPSDSLSWLDFAEGATIEGLLQEDLTDWSALDTILTRIIAAHPSHLTDEARLKAARTALLGDHKRSKMSGREDLCRAIASAYIRKRIERATAGEVRIQSFASLEFLRELVDPGYFEQLKEEEILALQKYLLRKFSADGDRLLLASSAYFHPAQKRRWKLTQQVISKLGQLGIIPGRPDK